MGKIRKIGKKIRRGIKKIGKKIGKAFKSIIKPFAKVFGKLGPLGSMAMMFILPGIGQMMAGWGANLAAGTSFLGTSLGTVGQLAGHAVKFVGNAINFVATAPQKIFQTITSGITNGWNALLGRDPTALNVSGMLETMDPSVVSEIVKEEGASWFGNFKADMQSVWTSGGAVDTLGKFGPKGEIVGKGNWFDYSRQGQAKLGSFGSDFKQMGTDIKKVFEKDNRIKVTADNVASTITDPAELELFNKGDHLKYVLDREGVFGNIRDVVGGTGSKIGDITVPGVGDVSDVASVSSMAMGAYSTLSPFVGSDDPVRGGSGMGYAATDQLGSIYDQGPTIQPWSFDPNISVAQNNMNAQNTWNTSLGFPQGFDPYATPGFGFSYPQWVQQQMAA